ncbi:MAG: DUF6495 family protein [Bacteroidia bacterium]
MKFKRLTIEELKELEPEFINFLSSAQITGKDWDTMKKNKIKKAEELIDVFSDMVYQKIMSKIQFLEYREEKTLNIFNCTNDKIILIGLRVKEHSSINLKMDDVFTQWNKSNLNSLNILKTEKKYLKEREVELFELLENGCLITNDKLYNILNEMI